MPRILQLCLLALMLLLAPAVASAEVPGPVVDAARRFVETRAAAVVSNTAHPFGKTDKLVFVGGKDTPSGGFSLLYCHVMSSLIFDDPTSYMFIDYEFTPDGKSLGARLVSDTSKIPPFMVSNATLMAGQIVLLQTVRLPLAVQAAAAGVSFSFSSADLMNWYLRSQSGAAQATRPAAKAVTWEAVHRHGFGGRWVKDSYTWYDDAIYEEVTDQETGRVLTSGWARYSFDDADNSRVTVRWDSGGVERASISWLGKDAFMYTITGHTDRTQVGWRLRFVRAGN